MYEYISISSRYYLCRAYCVAPYLGIHITVSERTYYTEGKNTTLTLREIFSRIQIVLYACIIYYVLLYCEIYSLKDGLCRLRPTSISKGDAFQSLIV